MVSQGGVLLLVSGLAVVAAAAVLVWVGWSQFATRRRQSRSAQDFLSRAVRAPALVTDVVARSAGSEVVRRNRRSRLYYTAVRFRTVDGHAVDAMTEIGVRSAAGLTAGSGVDVLYDSADPRRVRLERPSGVWPSVFHLRRSMGCMYVGLAALCLVVGLGVLLGGLLLG